MVRPLPVVYVDGENLCSLPLALGLLASISVVIAFCAGHSKQYYPRKNSKKNSNVASAASNVAAPSSLVLLRENIITSTGSKVDYRSGGEESGRVIISDPNEEFGEGGLWQKSILMGERCQPPQFPGVVFYDSAGKRVAELPRSPRTLSLTLARDGQ